MKYKVRLFTSAHRKKRRRPQGLINYVNGAHEHVNVTSTTPSNASTSENYHPARPNPQGISETSLEDTFQTSRPRRPCSMPIRDPDYIVKAMNEFSARKHQITDKKTSETTENTSVQILADNSEPVTKKSKRKL